MPCWIGPYSLPGLLPGLPGLLLQVAVLTFHALLLFAPSSRPREWRPGLLPPGLDSTAGSRGLTRRPGPVLLCFLFPSGLEPPLVLQSACTVISSNMEEETRPSRPSRKQASSSTQHAARGETQEAKQEQVGQTCSNEDFSNLRVVMSRARAREAPETCSNHRGRCCRGAAIVGLGGPPVPPTTCSGFALASCVPFHRVRTLVGDTCGGNMLTFGILSRHWRRDPGAWAAGGTTSGPELSGRGSVSNNVPTSMSPFLIHPF